MQKQDPDWLRYVTDLFNPVKTAAQALLASLPDPPAPTRPDPSKTEHSPKHCTCEQDDPRTWDTCIKHPPVAGARRIDPFDRITGARLGWCGATKHTKSALHTCDRPANHLENGGQVLHECRHGNVCNYTWTATILPYLRVINGMVFDESDAIIGQVSP